MKKISIIIGLVLGIFMLFPVIPASAQMGMMGDYGNNDASASQENQQKLDSQVTALLKSQNISSKDALDCSKISEEQLEQLGDTWMDAMIPDEAAHQNMDEMMGGEGSQNLTAMHVAMAERYLGCQAKESKNASWTPMMAGYGTTGMMNWHGHFGAFDILGYVVCFVFLINLILVGIWLWKQIRKK